MLGVHRGTISLVASNFEAAGLIHTLGARSSYLIKKALNAKPVLATISSVSTQIV